MTELVTMTPSAMIELREVLVLSQWQLKNEYHYTVNTSGMSKLDHQHSVSLCRFCYNGPMQGHMRTCVMGKCIESLGGDVTWEGAL